MRMRGSLRLAVGFGEDHADRKWTHQGDVVGAIYGEALPLDARLQRAVYRLKKIVAVVLHVEADEVGAEQTVENVALHRTDAEGLGVVPRNMPQDAPARSLTPLRNPPPHQ